MLLQMAHGLEGVGPGTLRTQLISRAEEGQHMLLVGQLAAAVASVTRQLFAPDLRFRRIEHARQVLVRAG